MRHLRKAERMQLEALAGILGIIFLLLLLVGSLLVLWGGREDEEEYEPSVRTLVNVWVMEVEEDGLLVFEDGEEHFYPYAEEMLGVTNMQSTEDQQSAENQESAGNRQSTADLQSAGDCQGASGLQSAENPESTENPESVEDVRDTLHLWEVRELLADVTLWDEAVYAIHTKTEKVNGKVLSANASGVVLEGIGRLEFSESVRGYQLYDSLCMCDWTDLIIGYDFSDFVVEDELICGILLVKEEAMERIRVLIRNSNYEGIFHESVTIGCDVDYVIYYGEEGNLTAERHEAGEVCTFTADSEYLKGDRVRVEPEALTGEITIYGLERSQGTPAYRGTLEIVAQEEGLTVINELLLEEYLYSVVPSEMPSSYPAEALRAQAICARTYAYRYMLHAGYPQYGAHVDDSTTYQVYNNIAEQEATTSAVKDTCGEILCDSEGNPAQTYYYSTSCGVGTTADVWRTEETGEPDYIVPQFINRTRMNLFTEEANGESDQETAEALTAGAEEAFVGSARITVESLRDNDIFETFISSVNEDDYEAEESWYRWSYTVEEIDTEHMLEVLQSRYQANSERVLTLNEKGEYVSLPVENLGKITDIYVAERGEGGVASALVIETTEVTIRVLTEYNIRCVLNDGETTVCRSDGSLVSCPTLLPSAFFILETSKEDGIVIGYTLTGGGYGHGVGMSQNAARSMAREGCTAGDILLFFYQNCSLEKIYT